MDNLRIEICTGFFSGDAPMQRELQDMCDQLEQTVAELESLTDQIDTLPPDLTRMQDAHVKLSGRIAQERQRLQLAQDFRLKYSDFIAHTADIDRQVGGRLEQQRKSVEQVGGRTVSRAAEERTLGERIADGWNSFWNAAGQFCETAVDKVADTAKSAYTTVKGWRDSINNYINRSLDQFIFGEYSDQDITLLSFGGNIAASVFGVDLPCDIRDGFYHITHWDELEHPWATLAIDVVALIPVIGTVKFLKYGDEVVDGIKVAGDALDLVGDGAKAVDKVSDAADTVADGAKTADKIGDTVDNLTDGAQAADKFSDILDESDQIAEEVIRETARHRKYIVAGDTFKVVDKSGQVLYEVKNVEHIESYHYIKKTDEQLDLARSEFNSKSKAEFLQKLVKEEKDALLKLGLDDVDMEDMLDGYVPEGFEVHHKLPLDDGGTNDMSNLILIDKESHKIFTGYQNTFTKTEEFKSNNAAIVDWIVPNGSVYIP